MAGRELGGWVEIVVGVDDDAAAELLAVELAATAAGGGVELRDAGTLLGAGGRRALVVAHARREEAAALVAEARRVAAELAGRGLPIGAPEIVEREVAEDWHDRWKAFFRVQRIGRIVVRPSWLDHVAAPDDVVVHLDPGRAFGTGSHASTRLVLAALDRRARQGPAPRRLLDLGCGSGILAIAALLLWPEAAALGLDVDPDACAVARENAERNGVAARLALEARGLGEAERGFDLVLANIQASVLTPLAGALARAVAPGGALVLSGLLAEEAGATEATFRAALAPAAVEAAVEDGWAALTLRR